MVPEGWRLRAVLWRTDEREPARGDVAVLGGRRGPQRLRRLRPDRRSPHPLVLVRDALPDRLKPTAAAGRISALRDPDVTVQTGGPQLLLAELCLLNRRDDRPVVADRAVLRSPGTQPGRLEGHPWDP